MNPRIRSEREHWRTIYNDDNQAQASRTVRGHMNALLDYIDELHRAAAVGMVSMNPRVRSEREAVGKQRFADLQETIACINVADLNALRAYIDELENAADDNGKRFLQLEQIENTAERFASQLRRLRTESLAPPNTPTCGICRDVHLFEQLHRDNKPIWFCPKCGNVTPREVVKVH